MIKTHTLITHLVLDRFLKTLQRLADEFGVAVVITNQASYNHISKFFAILYAALTISLLDFKIVICRWSKTIWVVGRQCFRPDQASSPSGVTSWRMQQQRGCG